MTLNRMKLGAVSFCMAGLITAPAFANDTPDIRKAIECRPAKDIVKLLSKFDKMDPEKRDTVDAFISAKFTVDEGQAPPERMFMRNGDQDIPLTILPDGTVSDFARLGDMPKDSEICIEDQARAGLPREEDGLSFGVDFDVKFKNSTGEHTLEELRDGAKDGKSFYKKLVPAPIRLLLPKMTHLSLTFDDPDALGQTVELFSGDRKIEGLIAESFGGSQVIEIDQIENLGADRLVITGGKYVLEPSPSVEKMKKLGFTEDEQEDSDKNAKDDK